MAKTLILRPISDASSEHSKSSGSNAYSLINEASQDGDTTYIYQLVNSTSSVTKKTVCKVGGTAPSKLYYVTQSVATVIGKVDDTSSSSTKEVIVAIRTDPSGSDFNRTKTNCNTTTYTKYSTGNSSIGRGYYEPGTLPDLWILAATSGNKGTSKSGNKEIRITQAYITLTIADAYRCAAIAIGGCTASVSDTLSAGASRTWTATVQDGYAFAGWMDQENYQKYWNGESYSVISSDLTYDSGSISKDMTLYACAYRTDPPVISVVSQDAVKVSGRTSKTRCSVKFNCDQRIVDFEARAQKTASADWSGRNGVIVEDGEPLEVNDEGWVYVDYNELTNGDGQYDVKIFGRNEGGVWSE